MMSGSRTGGLATVRARPAWQQPAPIPGSGFRYPTFGYAPRLTGPAPAAPVGAPPPAVLTAGQRDKAGQQPGSGGGWGPAADGRGFNPDGAEQSDFGDLGEQPGEMNSLADVASVLGTIGSFGLAAVSGNPLGMVNAIASSPIGLGLAKGVNSALGLSSPAIGTMAAESKSDIANPAQETQGRSVVGTIAGMAGVPSLGSRGFSMSKGPPPANPAVVTNEVTTQTPATVTAAPATVSAEEASLGSFGIDGGAIGTGQMGNNPTGGETGGNFGEGANTAGGSVNADPSVSGDPTGSMGMGSVGSESGGKGGGGGGVGDGIGGEAGESSPGDPGGGDKRWGGPTGNDGDGRLSEVPITAHEGEFVLSPEAVAMIGEDTLQMVNDMALEAAGHPPRPINPRAVIQSPLSGVRAGPMPMVVPGSRGNALAAQGGQQSAPIDRGTLPMPGYGGAPIPAPQMAAAAFPALAGVTALASPAAGPPLPGPPPGPFPMPPTTPMGAADGFHENAVPFTDQGQRPLVGVPPAPPGPARGAPARRGAAGGGGSGLTTDQLNAMSLDLARGEGVPPTDGPGMQAYNRIRNRMHNTPPAYRMGGMVQRAGWHGGGMPAEITDADLGGEVWGENLPHALHEPPPMVIYGLEDEAMQMPVAPEFGPQDVARRFGRGYETPQFRMGGMVEPQPDPAAEVEPPMNMTAPAPGGALPSSSQPYANEGAGDMPWGDDPSAPPGGGMDDVQMRLAQLPPEMRQAVAMAIGGNPMLASALLQVLGPHFAPLIQAAMGAARPPQPDPLEMLASGGAMGGAPMPAS